VSGIWIYSEDRKLAEELLTLGFDLKESMGQEVGVITLDPENAQEFIGFGADRVVILKGRKNWPEGYAAAIAKILGKEEASVFIVGATLRGKDIAAKVASFLNAGLVSEALSVKAGEGYLETTRLVYGGLAVATEQTYLPALVSIAPKSYKSPQFKEDRTGEINEVEVEDDTAVNLIEICPLVSEGVDLAAAEKIVCVGRGFNQKEDLKIAEDLAHVLGAEIACTRGIAEDYKWLAEERYVGISGQKVKPELYIGIGVSGQIQHVVGIRDSKVIVAINKDENSPIFEVADYGVVGDLYEVVPLLTEALKKN